MGNFAVGALGPWACHFHLIERLLCKDPTSAYNGFAPWRYADLPRALGCGDWFTARVGTCELDTALEQAARATTGVYVEVVADAYAASPLALKLHENFSSLYRGLYLEPHVHWFLYRVEPVML